MSAGKQTGRVVAAGTIANVLEWYDFAIYGYFAATIGRTFFPAEDPVVMAAVAISLASILTFRDSDPASPLA